MKKIVFVVLGLIAVIEVLFYRTPMIHSLNWWLTGNFIGIVATTLLLGGAIGMALVATAYSSNYRTSNKAWATGISAVILLVVWGLFLWMQADVYGTSMGHSFTPQPITLADLGTTTNPRFVAFDVALATAMSQQSDPRKVVADLDTVFTPEGMVWAGGRQPNGFFNRFGARTDAVAVIDDLGSSRYVPASFDCSENGWFGSSVFWQLHSEMYFADYSEIIYWPQVDGSWLMVAPITTRRFEFPNFIPQWGGAAVVDNNCDVDILTPVQAMVDPRLTGAQIRPSELVYDQASHWGFRFGGLWNQLFLHREQVEINDLGRSLNGQPYQIDTALGRVWMVAAEPHGEESRAIFKLFLFSATSDQVWSISFDQNQPMVGPAKGASFAKGGTSGYVWTEEGSTSSGGTNTSGTYVLIEPRPLTREGQLYWMYTVTTNDYGGTTMTVMVNAGQTSQVMHFCSRDSLLRWLAANGQSDSIPCSAQTGTPTIPPPSDQPPSGDLNTLSSEQLWQLIEEAQRILRGRGQ